MNYLIGYLAVVNVIAYIYMYVVYRIKVLDVPEKTNKVVVTIFCFAFGFIGVFLCREMFNIEDDSSYYKKVIIPILVVELIVIFIAGNGTLRDSLSKINLKGLLTNEISLNDTIEELNMLPEEVLNETNKTMNNTTNETVNEIKENTVSNNAVSENEVSTNETNETENSTTNETITNTENTSSNTSYDVDYNDILGSAQNIFDSLAN